MASPDGEDLPGLEEAFAALKQLADAYLQGGVQASVGEAPADESGYAPPHATFVADGAGIVRAIDEEAQRLLGRRPEEVVGARVGSVLGKLPAPGGAARGQIHREDGRQVSVWIARTDVPVGDVTHTVVTVSEKDVVSSRRTDLRYRNLVEQIPAVVFTGALDGGLYDVYVSPQIESLLGYSQAEWVADPTLWYERLHPDDRRKLDEEFARGCLTGGPFRADCRFITRDDKVVWVHGEARLIKDARGVPLLLQGVAFDITETKRGEEIARASLREKETLLKEIHHRVKNNLQVTSSLLHLQGERISDPSARSALRDSQNRIRSMALVHELLYRSKDLSRVDLAEYVRNLTRQLLRSHAVPSSLVHVDVKLVPVGLPVDIAVPCGLILNELVSNSLAHAFPDGRKGTITIELERRPEVDELVVHDDGIGLPADLDVRAGATLGLRLIRTLADQIDAELLVQSDSGTKVSLRIPRQREDRT